MPVDPQRGGDLALVPCDPAFELRYSRPSFLKRHRIGRSLGDVERQQFSEARRVSAAADCVGLVRTAANALLLLTDGDPAAPLEIPGPGFIVTITRTRTDA